MTIAQPVGKCISLDAARPGERVRLRAVDSGCGLQARLASMGLVPGVEMEVIQNGRSGPFIVAVKESRIMLGRGMAHKITVE